MLKFLQRWFLEKVNSLNEKAYRQKIDSIIKNENIFHDKIFIEDFFSVDLPKNQFTIILGDCVHFKKYCHILMGSNSKLTIGANVFFNNYCSINCLYDISIGENTMFGESVKIYDHNHHYELRTQTIISKDKFTTDSIKIGSNCWIGSNVTILKGVEIGNNVIIGANNLIFKSIPDNSIIKGGFIKIDERK